MSRVHRLKNGGQQRKLWLYSDRYAYMQVCKLMLLRDRVSYSCAVVPDLNSPCGVGSGKADGNGPRYFWRSSNLEGGECFQATAF